MKTKTPWTPIKWPYNSAEPYASWQCFARKYSGGRLIIYPSPFRAGEWSYVASFGANSDRSHSGGFPDGYTLEQAKAHLQMQIDNGKYSAGRD